jgi:hypothetical protein
MATKKKAEFTKSTAQVDLEARLESGNKSDRVLSTADSYEAPKDEGGRDMRVEGNDVSAYVGVDPIYQNYADETHMPRKGEAADDKVTEQFVKNLNPVVEGPVEVEDEEDDDTPSTGESGGPSTPESTVNPVAPVGEQGQPDAGGDNADKTQGN